MAVYTTIDDAGSFFNTKLYTGTGSSLAVTGAGFQPDLTWIKNRDAADFHVLTNSVTGATKYVRSNASTAETTDAETLKSFDSDGFTVGTTAEVNTNTEDYTSWNWKAGTTTGIDATGASITPSSYSFNATSGFSLIKYTGNGSAGATIPHGLGTSDIGLIICKNLALSSWAVQHKSLGPTKFLYLDETQAVQTDTTRWNDTAPTSVLFSVGTSGVVNTNTAEYVAHVFANVQGYSKSGSYVGNGIANGAFVYTGFRPAFVLFKAIATSENWNIYDDKRLGYNVDNDALNPNTTGTGYTTDDMDIVSNGFKLFTTNSRVNGSGATYIYMAFAEAPFVNSNGVPVNAR